LGFKSANDEPHRDPTEVEVYVYTARHEWAYSQTFKLEFDKDKRHETLRFEMKSVYRTEALLFYFVNERKSNEMQLNQIKVFYKEQS